MHSYQISVGVNEFVRNQIESMSGTLDLKIAEASKLAIERGLPEVMAMTSDDLAHYVDDFEYSGSGIPEYVQVIFMDRIDNLLDSFCRDTNTSRRTIVAIALSLGAAKYEEDEEKINTLSEYCFFNC